MTQQTIPSPPSIYSTLPTDTFSLIFHYHKFHLDYSHHFQLEYKDWKFLARYGYCLRFKANKGRTHTMDGPLVKKFLERCRCEEKPHFHYIALSDISCISNHMFPLLRGIHGLKLWNTNGWSPDALENLRGIHTLQVYCQPFPITNDHLRHLRGIKKLELVRCCNILITHKGYENLRGIEELHFVQNQGGPYFSSLEHISDLFRNVSGLKSFILVGYMGIISDVGKKYKEMGAEKLTSETCLKYLRGVQYLDIAERSKETTEAHEQMMHDITRSLNVRRK